MYTKKYFLFVSILILLSCNNATNNTNSDTTTHAQIIDGHNAQNALDWAGTYTGVIPCASCPGINTTITLNNDGTYEKTVQYLESNDKPHTTKGNFKWSADKTYITVDENNYLIGENKLFMLDADNKTIEGDLADNYILTKTNLEAEPTVNDGSTLQTYNGDDGKEYNIVYNTTATPPTATVQYDNAEKLLQQKEAWAKGAEYEGKDIHLYVNGASATLTIKGKKINLQEE